MSIYPIEKTREFYFSDQGYNCLKYLDQKGLLRYYVYNDLVGDLNNDLRDCLPSISDYTFKICSTSSCITSIPPDKSTFLSSYLIAGNTTNYDHRLINLWIWLK